MNTFIICGYGIPENIKHDVNYVTYLNIVFNSIFEIVKNQYALIIPCGGPTAMKEPLNKTEAQTIAEYIQSLMGRSEVNDQTKNWNIKLEDRSLSTLENLVFAKDIIEETGGVIHIFCEATRPKRVERLASEIFRDQHVRIHAIDFDVSKNRYLDSEIIQKKEESALISALWALKSEDNMKQYRKFFENKFTFLREKHKQGMNHEDAVELWFEHIAKTHGELEPVVI